MKNNKGFGKFEVMTLIVVLLVIFAYLMYTILGLNDSMSKKYKKFEEAAIQFNKTVFSNTDSFNNEWLVYLEEVSDLGLLDKFKNPFGSDTCDFSESKVVSNDIIRKVTLKCGDYLIKDVDSAAIVDVPIYKVGKWSEEAIEGDNVETKELYNCLENGKELFDSYLEDTYLVFSLNKRYSTSYYDINSIPQDSCNLVKKTFYRTLELQDRSK